MTSRLVYEGVLIEMNKVNAPSLLLEDFNYLFNKAINLYINKRYNIYDINQQTTDDLRVLKATAIIPVSIASGTGKTYTNKKLFGATYEFDMPSDYLHTLNCICNFKVTKNFKCYDANTYVQFNATRLTADMWGQVINNFYMRPQYKRPYYYIHNVNTSTTVPTNPVLLTPNPKYYIKTSTSTSGEEVIGDINCPAYKYNNALYYFVTTTTVTGLFAYTDGSRVNHYYDLTSTKPTGWPDSGLGKGTDGELSRDLISDANLNDLVERTATIRYGNASTVRMEVRCGKSNDIFTLEEVYVDYIKAPLHIRLTQELLDLEEDTSQMMEFPDYVCQEIINELVKLVMENAGDPRLQTNLAVNQSIANPAAQQLQPNQ